MLMDHSALVDESILFYFLKKLCVGKMNNMDFHESVYDGILLCG